MHPLCEPYQLLAAAAAAPAPAVMKVAANIQLNITAINKIQTTCESCFFRSKPVNKSATVRTICCSSFHYSLPRRAQQHARKQVQLCSHLNWSLASLDRLFITSALFRVEWHCCATQSRPVWQPSSKPAATCQRFAIKPTIITTDGRPSKRLRAAYNWITTCC